ncbi:hypothetical protein ACWEOE_12540 [Amycolatopsis sp. NPDC004368]
MENGAAGQLREGLGRGREPVGAGDRRQRHEAEVRPEEAIDVGDLDRVPDGAVRGHHAGCRIAFVVGEVRGVAEELARQLVGEQFVEPVRLGDEDLQAGTPVVVGGAFGVEAEDIGAPPEECGGVGDAAPFEDRAHGFVVEAAGEVEAGQEVHSGECVACDGRAARGFSGGLDVRPARRHGCGPPGR